MYKSVVSSEWKITASVLRIGKDGSCVDNLHAGGLMIKIEPYSGYLGHYLLDSNGNRYSSWNGLDYSNSECIIPNWNEVREFAIKVADKYIGFHLIALDVCLNQDDQPVLIEVNVKDFSFWIPMLFDFDVFDGEHEKLIDYCIKNQ